MFAKAQEYAKFLVALVGSFATAGSTFIPAEWSPYVSLVLALLTTIATYAVPNVKPTADDEPKHLLD
jgi:hypothetical protein